MITAESLNKISQENWNKIYKKKEKKVEQAVIDIGKQLEKSAKNGKFYDTVNLFDYGVGDDPSSTMAKDILKNNGFIVDNYGYGGIIVSWD